MSAREIIDPHHHFLEPQSNAFQGFLKSLGVPMYGADAYLADLASVPIKKSVHVEAMPDDGVAEVEWVDRLVQEGKAPTVGAIVAQCDLSADDASAQLDAIKAASSLVRGIRYILDYDGPFDGTNATHVGVSRFGKDMLRDPAAAPLFERGFALLAAKGLSYDLQCAPAQLPAAAAMCARHPGVTVVIDHLGKPRHLKGDGGDGDARELAVWREGMALMAALPQVHVKLSMLGYSVPGWSSDPAKEAFLRDLVREIIKLFGAKRCMFASNFHVNGAVSDGDGAEETGPTVPELYAAFARWVEDLPEGEQARLFAGTAAEVYRL